MRDFAASAAFAALIDGRQQASNRGSRCRKLRLSREESRRRSMAGMRRREEINRANAMAFIAEHPARQAEYERRNGRAS